MNTFHHIPRAELPPQWPRLSALLKPAVDMGCGELEVDDILDMALEGRMFVFADDVFALVAEFTYFPRKTTINVSYAGGKIRDNQHVNAVVSEFGRLGGATAMTTCCKNPAMTRYHKRFGFTPTYTLLEKQI